MIVQTIPQPTSVSQPRRKESPAELSLFQRGYRCRATPYLHKFAVTKPDGTTYYTDPIDDTCTCPARVRCKHLIGLENLIRDSAIYAGDLGRSKADLTDWEAYDLLCQWDDVQESLSEYGTRAERRIAA
jgi:hypothetical protein